MTTMTRLARMATILRMLRDAGGYPVESQKLWDAIPDYQGGAPTGRRYYREDIGELKSRGLIRSGISTHNMPLHNGVALRLIGKPTDWHLTKPEHEALRIARRRRSGPLPSAVAHGTRPRSDLDIAMSAFRVLEEHDEWMTVDALAEELHYPLTWVFAVLMDIWRTEIRCDPLFAGVLDIKPIKDGERIEDDDWDSDPERVQVRVERKPHAQRQSRWARLYGTDSIGRFAYTADETSDRLALIEAELNDPGEDTDTEALSSAQRKLTNWSAHLAEKVDDRS
jgi:hypothetical protein